MRQLLTVVCGACIAPSAFASVTSIATEFGVDTGSFDSTQGLVFLDLTLSTEISYDQMVDVELMAGGGFVGWRHATDLEIRALFVSAGLSDPGSIGSISEPGEVAIAGDLMDMLGITVTDPGITGVRGISSIEGPLPDTHMKWQVAFAFGNTIYGNNGTHSDDIASVRLGHWLVRDVPAPGTAALIGVAGLAAARRRR